MTTTPIALEDLQALVESVLLSNGCDNANASAVARTVTAAERDGAHAHGLFRVPGYVTALRSGRVRGAANPRVSTRTPVALRVDGDRGFAPLALERGIPPLADAAREFGVALLTLTDSYHFAALWPEVEALAEQNLAAIACVNYAAVMAPHGGHEAIFGTNPIAYAWPRRDAAPVVADMATSAMARGDIQLAAQAGESVPLGTGLGPTGEATTDPGAVLAGTQLPFGGHKGSALALLVELFAAAATGDAFSYEVTDEARDGGPVRGGEFLLALCPQTLAGPGHGESTDAFFRRFETLSGARLPGARRHRLRGEPGPRQIDTKLLDEVQRLRQ